MEESQCSSCAQKKWQAIAKELQTDFIAANLWNIYNNIFEYLATKILISENQSGFKLVKTGDSSVNQLLSITHEIYHSLDNGLKVRGVFLDIQSFWQSMTWNPDTQIEPIQNFGKS